MTAALLQHSSLPFSGPAAFVSEAVGLSRTALAQDAVPVLLCSGDTIAKVRRRGGKSVDAAVVGLDMDVAGRNPTRLIPALQRLLDEHPDRSLWCVAEMVRPGHSSPVLDEIELHELLLYLPHFAEWNCRLTCAYDTAGLSPDVAAGIAERHDSPPVDPADQVDRARSEPLSTRPMASEELGVDRTTLGALRGFIEDRAKAAGLDGDRVFDLVYAVNEVVTNSLCHGEGRARVSIWGSAGSVLCEVRDRGWIRDPLAGRIAPNPGGVSGRGLWLVNQLCDLVQVRSSPAGTTVRMHVDV